MLIFGENIKNKAKKPNPIAIMEGMKDTLPRIRLKNDIIRGSIWLHRTR